MIPEHELEEKIKRVLSAPKYTLGVICLSLEEGETAWEMIKKAPHALQMVVGRLDLLVHMATRDASSEKGKESVRTELERNGFVCPDDEFLKLFGKILALDKRVRDADIAALNRHLIRSYDEMRDEIELPVRLAA